MLYADCTNRTFYGPTGKISSPNFPLAYANYLSCYNYITAESGQKVGITFLTFNTEKNYDIVTVSIKLSNANIW